MAEPADDKGLTERLTRKLGNLSQGGTNRVNRGGSNWNNARNCRVSNRNNNDPSDRNNNLGLRLVLVPKLIGLPDGFPDLGADALTLNRKVS